MAATQQESIAQGQPEAERQVLRAVDDLMTWWAALSTPVNLPPPVVACLAAQEALDAVVGTRPVDRLRA